jgi:hypothetical protein
MSPGRWCRVQLRLSRSMVGFIPPKNKEKNNKVGNFPLCDSYVECVLKFTIHTVLALFFFSPFLFFSPRFNIQIVTQI